MIKGLITFILVNLGFIFGLYITIFRDGEFTGALFVIALFVLFNAPFIRNYFRS